MTDIYPLEKYPFLSGEIVRVSEVFREANRLKPHHDRAKVIEQDIAAKTAEIIVLGNESPGTINNVPFKDLSRLSRP